MKIRCLTVLLLLFSFNAFAQVDSIQARVVLIGDAGAFVKEDRVGVPGKHPVISAVKKNIRLDSKTVVLYLGDNLYKEGLPDDQTLGYLDAKAVLDTQISVNRGTNAKIIFIPGNHDWNNGGVHGWDAVLREQQYIDRLSNNSVRFLPRGGCPGPIEIPVSEDVTLVVMDSQWWLHESDKPGVESDCPYKTKDEVLVQLEDILQKNAHKLVIFACHHPFKSYGIHGGNFSLKQHIFPFTDLRPNLYIPLPLIGSIYPITRGIFGTIQDLPHPQYQNMVNEVTRVLKNHPNVIQVAGHEHTLQLIQDSSRNYIVSGSGCKTSRVNKGKNAVFVDEGLGFVTLEISKNKNVGVAFYVVDQDSATIEKKYENNLLNFSAPPTNEKDTVTKATVVAVQPFEDSVTAAPNMKFNQASGFKRFFLGNNYRKEWATPVKMKVLDIRKEKGGLTVKSIGGGKQTKTLTLTDKNGRDWVIRTVNKDPSKAIPENFHNSIAEDIAQDFISGSYPYAPLIVPPLAEKLNLSVPRPELYYVPDDPALGIYRNVFAKQVVTLEKKDPSVDNTDTKSSFTVFDKMIEDNDHRVDQQAVLRARLLDILIADWDRHLDQWKFGVADTGKGKLYYPIPRDRDQAFYYSDGAVLKYIAGSMLPFLKGFRKDIPKINWLNWPARDFDRLFLNDLDWNDWQTIIRGFQAALTDDVLQEAISKLPAEVRGISGPAFFEKLKSRRDLMMNRANDYYDFISDQVNVLGSNQDEYFRVTAAGRGFRVQVFKRTEKTDSASRMYDRVFTPDETDEVHLYGFNGSDIFDVDPQVHSRVRLRIIGGKGTDTFNIRGNVRNYIYDVSVDSNYIEHRSRSKIFIDEDPLRNYYTIKGFEYNINRLPTINLAYNVEDRLMVGLGFSRKTYGFRKDPYATYQRLTTLYAVNRNAYQVHYSGEFNQLIGLNDIVVDARITEPVLNNFFGLGNATKSVNDRDYYRVRHSYVSADLLLRKRMNAVLSFTIGPAFYNYWNHPEENKGRILEKPALIGLDSASVYTTKTYLGGKAGMLIDFIDNAFLPTRGIYWTTELTSYAGLNRNAGPLTRFRTDMTVYGSLSIPAKATAILKAGGGHIFNRNFEYFQALSLGQNNFLRGFRKDRFAGRGLAYGSLELRLRLMRSKSYLFPGDMGLIGFAEAGRVWMPHEHSRSWHSSYGAGLYYTPFNLVIVSGTVAFSKEETLFNFSVGTRFNLTF
ncbi:MAG TPA: BamA/TamA family outer membrane protein [Chitinophagaceae bacterium]